MVHDPKKDEWVQRVLGVAIAGPEPAPTGSGVGGVEAAFHTLTDGFERVGNQITRLQAELRASEDPSLQAIAEFGLNALTKGARVKLMAAVMPIVSGTSGDVGADVAKARKQVAELLKLLVVDRKIRAFDGNPFGVDVAIASTLKPRLLLLTQAMKTL